MACKAVGNFPKELPIECVLELATKLKAGGSTKAELMQIAAQILGQVGSMLDKPTLVTTAEAPDEELGAELEALATATFGAEEMLIKLLLPILMKLFAKYLN